MLRVITLLILSISLTNVTYAGPLKSIGIQVAAGAISKAVGMGPIGTHNAVENPGSKEFKKERQRRVDSGLDK